MIKNSSRNTQETKLLNAFGKTVRQQRENARYTQEEFAEIVGFTRSCVTEKERLKSGQFKYHHPFVLLTKIYWWYIVYKKSWLILLLLKLCRRCCGKFKSCSKEG